MIILAIKTVPPCVLTAASIPSLAQAQAIPSLRNSWKPCTVTGLKSKEQACLFFINVDQAKCSTSGTSPCKNQRLKRICGRGGIGRLGGFRFLCESVQVRVLSPAPYRVFITDLTVADTRFFFFAGYCEQDISYAVEFAWFL